MIWDVGNVLAPTVEGANVPLITILNRRENWSNLISHCIKNGKHNA